MVSRYESSLCTSILADCHMINIAYDGHCKSLMFQYPLIIKLASIFRMIFSIKDQCVKYGLARCEGLSAVHAMAILIEEF